MKRLKRMNEYVMGFQQPKAFKKLLQQLSAQK
jgi:hypothetical protein